MKFQEYPYKRPDEKQTLKAYARILEQMQSAASFEEFFKAFEAFDALNAEIETQFALASVRHTMNTADSFYEGESDYLDAFAPVLEAKQSELIRAVFASPYLEALKEKIPAVWLLKNEMRLKTIDGKIIEDLKEENSLASEYQKLIASSQIEFDGQTYTLASLEEKMNDKDRTVRRQAHLAYWNWFADHEEELGAIYDALVKVRASIAQKMGYDNYIPFGYLRMSRLDYDENDVAAYRKTILHTVVPVVSSLMDAQAKRLGLLESGRLPVWEEKMKFLSGNPLPKYDRQEMVRRADQMYHALSKESGMFFERMREDELMDLDARPNKAAGGYCTSFPQYKTPFIFANFNRTQSDIETLTHEAGHAFQAWMSRDLFPSDCVWPTMESAEIDSMSMEFFTWPWMHLFFEEDTDKYQYSHLAGALEFLPYGVLVDHFQHEVYANPQWSHADRMAAWRSLEKQYQPYKDYTDIDVLERGGWWMRQLHIFMDPFYYIDYTLAQVVALQFWSRMIHQDPKAFEDYLALCKAGGTLSFTQLVRLAHLRVPFEEGCLDETMQDVQHWLEGWSQQHPDLR